MARKNALRCDSVESVQQPAHVVHQAVDALVGDLLALVAAATQDGELLRPFALEEVLDERGLADARAPVEEHRDRLSAEDARERASELLQLGLAAEQNAGRPGRRWRGGRHRAPDGCQLLCASPSPGVMGEERHAQRGQLRRDTWLHLEGRGESRAGGAGGELLPAEGQPSGQSLVEHDAHRVPVARRGQLLAPGLLRRHVLRRPSALDALPQLAGFDLGGQTEIEEHHAVFRRDEHVGGLDVPMQLAFPVQERRGRWRAGRVPSAVAVHRHRGPAGHVAGRCVPGRTPW